MSLPKDQAWFAAKKYGYGWGWPKRWQGWVVMLVWLGFIGAMALIAGRSHPFAWISFTVISSVAMVGICQWKGEVAKWRWGGKDEGLDARK